MRAHITFAVKDTNRDPSYTVALRYLGVEVQLVHCCSYPPPPSSPSAFRQVVPIKDLAFQRSRNQGCRYDLIIVARREVYDDVFDKLQVLSCPLTSSVNSLWW